MRLWSIHPKYLDTKGLTTCWREGLLAKKVLEGKTNGYKNHPQLIRFKNSSNPIEYINEYLYQIYLEASLRGYKYDISKLKQTKKHLEQLTVNDKQVEYEFNHLQKKLKIRDKIKYNSNLKIGKIELHPLFKEIKGKIEEWEKINELLYYGEFKEIFNTREW